MCLNYNLFKPNTRKKLNNTFTTKNNKNGIFILSPPKCPCTTASNYSCCHFDSLVPQFSFLFLFLFFSQLNFISIEFITKVLSFSSFVLFSSSSFSKSCFPRPAKEKKNPSSNNSDLGISLQNARRTHHVEHICSQKESMRVNTVSNVSLHR